MVDQLWTLCLPLIKAKKRIGREEESGKGEGRKSRMSEEKSIIWRRLDIAGHEYVRVFSEDSKYFLDGAAIFVDEGKFCRLDYKIECDGNWETLTAQVSGFVGDEKIAVEISVDSEKRWTMNGKEISAVENCTDIDLNFSPATNTLPVRRLNLEVGMKEKVRAAWVRFPSFALEPLEQTYKRTGKNSYHYESAGGKFVTDLEVDDFGLVVNYPNLWQIEKGDA